MNILRNLLIAMVFVFLLMPTQVYAEDIIETPVAETTAIVGETIPTGDVYEGNADDLILKTEQMSKDLHSAATRVIIPITLIVVVIGAIVGIFVPLMRQVVLFAILGLIAVMWAPMIVNGISNWVRV